MNISAVHNFVSLGASSYSLLRDRSTFLEVNWGDEAELIVERWNALVSAPLQVTGGGETTQIAPGFTHRFIFQGRESLVQYAASRDDSFIAFITMSALVAPVVDMRFCTLSLGNSDLWFCPLMPYEWADLESQLGRETIDRAFRRLPPTFEEFALFLE